MVLRTDDADPLRRVRRNRRLAAAAGCAFSLAGIAAARAQALPGGFNPIPQALPQTSPRVGGPLPVLPQAGPNGAVPDVNVTVRAISIEGATVYPDAKLQTLTAGLVGPATKLAAIEKARAAILGLYRNDGYLLTTVSAALGKDGLLRFVVTEGRIAAVKLDGDIGPAGTQVLRFLNHLTLEGPVNIANLERWLLLAQDVPGVSLHAILQPSTDEPGALTLVAQVSRQAVSGLFTIDNRAFNLTGPVEWLTVLDLNSLTEFGERTEFSLYQTEGGTQIFGQASIETFLGGSGLKMRVYGGSGNALPSGELRALGYDGTTTVGGVSLSYPLIKRRQEVLNLNGYFDILQSNINTNTGPGGATALTSQDSLRVLRASADYARQDLWLGSSHPAIDTATVRVSQGIAGLGATAANDQLAARLGENAGFTKVNFEISRNQTLFQISPDVTVSLYGLVAGQYSGDILPPAEKFYLGGARLNRGFYYGEVTGDSALSTSIELQLNTTLNLSVFSHPMTIGAQYYGFWDWGETWQNLSTDNNNLLSSAGGGARFSLTRYLEFDVEGVARFTRQPYGSSSNLPPLSAAAFYWRVLARF